MGNKTRSVKIAAMPILFLLIVTLVYVVLFTSDATVFYKWNPELANWKYNSMRVPVDVLVRRLVGGEDRIQLDKTGFSCHSDVHSEVCVTNKSVRIVNNALKVYIPSYESQLNVTVKPYARKEDAGAMNRVTPVQILTGDSNLPACQFTHAVPAMIFSSGGHTGNLFHEFNEIIIPLFLTCHHFRSSLQFVITDYNPQWVSRYKRILSMLSTNKDIINSAANEGVHCFNGAVIGLKYHDNLAINSTYIPGGYSMYDFKSFLARAYNLKNINVHKSEKPVLLLISRQQSRAFLNEEKLVVMMKELGFKVVISTPEITSNHEIFSKIVNSCSVMVGVHGAGLTNQVFLPSGAVMVQVVPLGLQWPSTYYFGMPSGGMGIKYLEYKIESEESSLYEQYGKDHIVITDPASIEKKGFKAFRALYLTGQNVKLNVSRFRETLVKALQLLGDSTP